MSLSWIYTCGKGCQNQIQRHLQQLLQITLPPLVESVEQATQAKKG